MTYTTPQSLEELRELQRKTTELLQEHEFALDQRRMQAQGKAPTSLAGKTSAQRRAEAGLPSEVTMAAYRRRADRLLADAAEYGVDVWHLALDRAGTKGSWYAARAALQTVVIVDMRAAKRRIDEIVRLASGKALSRSDQDALVESGRTLARLANVLTKTPDGVPMTGLGQPTRRRATSKSKSLRGLREEWRESLASELPPQVRMAWLVQCVAGCRPVELAKGVELELTGDGRLYTKVSGAKLKHNAGQPTRETLLAVDAGPAAMLAKLLKPGEHVTVQLDRSVDAYRKLVSRHARKLTPRRGAETSVSSYSARHQYKSDLDAAGLSRTDVAQAMGHQAVETAKYYGGSGGNGSSAVKPVAVFAAKAVRNRQRHLAVSSRSLTAPVEAPPATAPAAQSAPATVSMATPTAAPAKNAATATAASAPSKVKRPRP